MYCIDASVFINSEIEEEQFHEYSAKLMQMIRERGLTIIVPEIILPEVSSAIARGTDDPEKAQEFVKELKQIPNIVFIPVDRELADESSRLAAEYRLRGAMQFMWPWHLCLMPNLSASINNRVKGHRNVLRWQCRRMN